MLFTETKLPGAYVIDIAPHKDDRGFFARTFCEREFTEHNLVNAFVQCNVSLTRFKGTLRGLHFQRSPACEVKLVRCTQGSLFDVIVDLRPDSPTYLQHIGMELTAQNHRALYVPAMFAHGFQTLEDETEAFYQMTEFHSPGLATGMRHDDPRLEIRWPLSVSVISERDRTWPLLGE